MTEPGHRDTFGPPDRGWPTFGPDGRIEREREDDDEETEA